MSGHLDKDARFTVPPGSVAIEADRVESALDMPGVACVLVDGAKCWVRAAEKMGVAAAEMDGLSVVTVAFARLSMGINAGLYTALSPAEARAMAASLNRAADFAEQPKPGAR